MNKRKDMVSFIVKETGVKKEHVELVYESLLNFMEDTLKKEGEVKLPNLCKATIKKITKKNVPFFDKEKRLDIEGKTVRLFTFESFKKRFE